MALSPIVKRIFFPIFIAMMAVPFPLAALSIAQKESHPIFIQILFLLVLSTPIFLFFLHRMRRYHLLILPVIVIVQFFAATFFFADKTGALSQIGLLILLFAESTYVIFALSRVAARACIQKFSPLRSQKIPIIIAVAITSFFFYSVVVFTYQQWTGSSPVTDALRMIQAYPENTNRVVPKKNYVSGDEISFVGTVSEFVDLSAIDGPYYLEIDTVAGKRRVFFSPSGGGYGPRNPGCPYTVEAYLKISGTPVAVFGKVLGENEVSLCGSEKYYIIPRIIQQ